MTDADLAVTNKIADLALPVPVYADKYTAVWAAYEAALKKNTEAAGIQLAADATKEVSDAHKAAVDAAKLVFTLA